jgi:hypothetical protein
LRKIPLLQAALLACILSAGFLVVSRTTAPVDALPTVAVLVYELPGSGGPYGGKPIVVALVSADVVGVEFYIDGSLSLNQTEPNQWFDTSSGNWVKSFWWNIDSDAYPPGEHTVKAVAYNPSNERASSQITKTFRQNLLPLIAVAAVIPVSGAILFVLLRGMRRLPLSPEEAGFLGLRTKLAITSAERLEIVRVLNEKPGMSEQELAMELNRLDEHGRSSLRFQLDALVDAKALRIDRARYYSLVEAHTLKRMAQVG